jgi:TonB family protein
MSNYLIELSVTHAVLMFGYWLFLRKERQYAKMRFFLIGSTLLALVIPLLKLPKLFFDSADPETTVVIPLNAMAVGRVTDSSTWNFDFLIWIYVAISVFFFLKFSGSVLYLIYLERKSTYEKFNDLYIRRVQNISGSFSFFQWIFLSDKIDKNQHDYDVMLKHEKAHATLGHSYDLVFLELFKVCFWWLPTTWFIIKEIRKLHEYQADAYALKSYNVDQYSSILISSTLKTNGLSLASSFHDGLIFKRLTAMKLQTKNVSPWKLGALVFLCVILFVVFACSEEPSQQSKDSSGETSSVESKAQGEVFTIVEALPQYPGGMDALYAYIAKEIKYPKQARRLGVEGRVDVEFVVEKDGTLSDVKAIDGIGAGCDGEAVRVVQNAGTFTPGTQRGKTVRVRMVLPIIFKLNDGKKNEDNTTQGIVIIEKIESKNEGPLKVDANYTDGEWSGTVYTPDGESLPGVNIIVAGTTTGTVSDISGAFKVKAGESQDLVLSFVGYESVKLERK